MASRLAAAILFLVVLCGCGREAGATHRGGTTARPAGRTAVVAKQVFTIGYSVQHRAIDAVEIGDPRQLRRMLIVGCIHGNEPAGIAIARWLISVAHPLSTTTLWVGVCPGEKPSGR